MEATRSGGAWRYTHPGCKETYLIIADNFRGAWTSVNFGGDWRGGSGTSYSDTIQDNAPGSGYYMLWKFYP